MTRIDWNDPRLHNHPEGRRALMHHRMARAADKGSRTQRHHRRAAERIARKVLRG